MQACVICFGIRYTSLLTLHAGESYELSTPVNSNTERYCSSSTSHHRGFYRGIRIWRDNTKMWWHACDVKCEICNLECRFPSPFFPRGRQLNLRRRKMINMSGNEGGGVLLYNSDFSLLLCFIMKYGGVYAKSGSLKLSNLKVLYIFDQIAHIVCLYS